MEASLLTLLTVLLIAWSAGLLANKCGFPSILGELAAGIIFGPGVLGAMGYGFTGPIPGLAMLAQVGIFALMLFIGMEVNPRDLVRNGKAGALAALGGFAVPFVVGYLIAVSSGYTTHAGIFLGMAMAVTSLATKSRILVDLNLFGTRIANVLLSGALLSDVGALLVFALVLGMAGQGEVDVREFIHVGIQAGAFFAIATLVGIKVLPWVGRWLKNAIQAERTGSFTFVMLVGLAYAEGAHLMGLHPIIGAFMAGMFLRQGVLKQRLSLEIAHGVRDLAVGFLAPIFFFTAGFHVTLDVVVEQPMFVALVLLAATISKILGTSIFYIFSGNGWREGLVIGAGMNGRGAVEIIIAEIALGMALIDNAMFSVLVLMAFFTTLTVPISMKIGTQWLARRDELVRTDDDRRGLIIIGATPLGRLLARQAVERGKEDVTIVDSNAQRCVRARKEGLPVIRGNALREDVMILAGARDAASLIALTPNASINQLACQFAVQSFGIPMVAQGWPEFADDDAPEEAAAPVLWHVKNPDIEQKLWEHRAERHPDEVMTKKVEELPEDFLSDRSRLPLFLLREERTLLPTAGPRPTDQLVFLRRPMGRYELAQRFNTAVGSAPVLDFAERIPFREFLKQACERLAPMTSESPEDLYKLFEKRENEFSSVLLPGLAIPHAQLPGDRPFVMLLARAREGIVFPGQQEPVQAVFLLLGGQKDRDTHLHALASIARCVSLPHFELSWKGAPDEEAIRQIIITNSGADDYESEVSEG